MRRVTLSNQAIFNLCTIAQSSRSVNFSRSQVAGYRVQGTSYRAISSSLSPCLRSPVSYFLVISSLVTDLEVVHRGVAIVLGRGVSVDLAEVRDGGVAVAGVAGVDIVVVARTGRVADRGVDLLRFDQVAPAAPPARDIVDQDVDRSAEGARILE